MTEAPTLERPATSAAATDTVPVTANDFVRAESDLYFGNAVSGAGGIGRFHHIREPMPIDHQTVIRGNRDTLYSAIVFDLDAGPVTITKPESGDRFMSMQVFDEDQYSRPTIYDPDELRLSRDNVDTRYVMVGFRTLVDPTVPGDLEKVHALQDSITASQVGGAGKWRHCWYEASRTPGQVTSSIAIRGGMCGRSATPFWCSQVQSPT